MANPQDLPPRRSWSSPRARSFPALLALVGPALLTSLFAACGDETPPVEPAAPATAATASTATATAADTHFGVTSGSALAVSPDGASVYVADEDHLAVLVVPASFRDPAATRVVQMPGPPAQIVASAGLVLVTVRTLPTDEARSAYEALRGKPSDAAAVTRLPASKLLDAPHLPFQTRFWVKKEYQALLDTSLDEVPDHENSQHGMPAPAKANPGTGKQPASSNGANATAAATASHAPRPKASPRTGTPAVPLDPKALRQSKGGLLIAYRPDAERGLVEVGRTVVAPDAWGIGVTPDGARAVVTSAWSGQVAVVDVAANKVVFTSDVPREPRGVAVSADGKTAWISHLVGADLTRIDSLDSAPRVAAQPLAPAPARTAIGTQPTASLAYAAVLSPDGRSLYVPRHAIGAEGVGAWWGAPVVDVLDVRTGKSSVPAHMPGSPSSTLPPGQVSPPADWTAHAGQAPSPDVTLTQPRAAVYRRTTDTLLVASEGWDTLTEVDALAADPSMAVVRTYDLGDIYDALGHYSLRGGAPTGIALSADERTAYVYCRTTFDVVKVDLESRRSEWLRVAEDALPTDASLGRRLFASARSPTVSGGLACASCHPEGRDDGYVWREGEMHRSDVDGARFVALRASLKTKDAFFRDEPKEPIKLYPRQTPMIAGRVRASGPYGWHAESPNIAVRLMAGFSLHRPAWDSMNSWEGGELVAKADYLMDYLRSGLVPPPSLARDLTAQEERGKAIFESDSARCASCHKPDTEHTDRVAYPLPALPTRFGFDDEDNKAFKTPSLRFLAGTAPYFHDGSAATLEDLVAKNGNRMGATLALSTDDKAALVAYLKTL